MFDGKIHYKWQFSIAMLVYQRVQSTQWQKHVEVSRIFQVPENVDEYISIDMPGRWLIPRKVKPCICIIYIYNIIYIYIDILYIIYILCIYIYIYYIIYIYIYWYIIYNIYIYCVYIYILYIYSNDANSCVTSGCFNDSCLFFPMANTSMISCVFSEL